MNAPDRPVDSVSDLVQVSYVDGTGRQREASAATRAAIEATLAAAESSGAGPVGAGPEAVEVRRCAEWTGDRGWGVFVALSALRVSDSADHGLGDLSALEELGVIVAELGGNVVSTLPLCATRPDEASPYSLSFAQSTA